MKVMTRGVAPAIVRTWVRVYTLGMPADVRLERLAEIESDLWDECVDRGGGLAAGASILTRLLRGIPDDVSWRFETLRGTSALGGMRLSRAGLRTQWPGIAAAAGGVLAIVGTVLSAVLEAPRLYSLRGAAFFADLTRYYALVFAADALIDVLLIVALIVFCRQNRHRLERGAGVALGVLLVGLLVRMRVSVAAAFLGLGFPESHAFLVLLQFTGVIVPAGYLFLGLSLPNPFRRVPFVLGGYLATRTLLGVIGAATLYRTPWGRLLSASGPFGFLLSIAFGAMLTWVGCTIWREAALGAEPTEDSVA